MRGWMVLCAMLVACAANAENLLENPSFEKAAGERVPGWNWEGGAAHAMCRADLAVARSGKVSLCLMNPTPRAPNVFSSSRRLWAFRPKPYTLSCTSRPTRAASLDRGGRRWQTPLFPAAKTEGGSACRLIFNRTGRDEFTLRINTDSATTGLWIDDVMLEPGAAATAFVYDAPLAVGESRLRSSRSTPARIW